MNDSLENLLSRHRGGSILIDTNILLLLFVGAFDRRFIPVFKRTASFLPEDFDLLLRLIGLIPKIVTTPHVLAEVNSLSGQLGEPKRTEYFAQFVTQIGLLDERYVASATAAAHAAFPADRPHRRGHPVPRGQGTARADGRLPLQQLPGRRERRLHQLQSHPVDRVVVGKGGLQGLIDFSRQGVGWAP